MPQTFPCATPGCNKQVTYQRVVVPGAAVKLLPNNRQEIVYLTCVNLHTNPYEVTVE